MKSTTFFTFILLIFRTTLIAQQPATEPASGRLLVRPGPQSTDASIQQLITAHGAKVHHKIEGINVLVLDVPNTAVDAVATALGNTHAFIFIERDQIAHASATVPNDTNFASQWHLTRIQAPTAWDMAKGSSSPPVAILDSGVDTTHPDLVSKIVPGWNYLSGTSDIRDVQGHGTAVAGVLAAATNNLTGVAGVTWANPIMPLVVMDVNGNASYSNIASAINYAADHGVRIINVSASGISASTTLQSAVDYAWSKGAVVIAAVGNYATSTTTYPTACNHVIAVSSTDLSDTIASYSNYGSFVSLAAPGANLLTTSMGGGYGYWAGTSLAAPVVSGVAALALSVNPSLTASALVSILENSADDLGTPGFDTFYGWGRVNAYKAVLAAKNLADATTPAVAISAPLAGATVSGAVAVKGTASDNIGVLPMAQAAVLWTGDMENGSMSQWSSDGGGGAYNSGLASDVASLDHAHTGLYGCKATITTPNSPTSGVALFRWKEARANQGAYYGAWFYFPVQYTITGQSWNLFQFKSRTADGSRNDPLWAVYLEPDGTGKLKAEIGWGWGGTVAAGPYSTSAVGGKWYHQSIASVPIGRWVHFEMYLYESKDFTGHLTFWQDGVQLFDFPNVRTSYDNPNYNTWRADDQWSIAHYSDGLTPNPSPIYFDDAVVSTTRIWTAVNSAPTVATAAKATPNPVTAKTTVLSVLGADNSGETALTYTWATTGTPPAPVTFSANSTNAAKNSTATFSKIGSYSFQVTIKDAAGLTVTSSVNATVSATLTIITVSPNPANVQVSQTLQFTSSGKDQFGASLVTQPTMTWTASGGGTIAATGLFTAGATAGGPFTITAAGGGKTGTASVTVATNAPPTVATAAKATPNPTTAKTTALSVLGADNGGETALTYTWATTGTPPAPVTFSANSTNAAKNSTATFSKIGSYSFQVIIKDAGGLTVTSSVIVTVSATLTTITLSPTSATVQTTKTQQFTASAKDQFGATFATQPTFSWTTSGGGTISSTGLFTAGATAGGPYTATAAGGGKSGTASVTVTLVGTLATDCKHYAAANGNDANAGTSLTAPKTLWGAASSSLPGDIICLLGGTYNMNKTLYPKSGTASAWIVYKNYGDSDVNLVWTAGSGASDLTMIHLYGSSLWTGANYLEFRGLKLDGQNQAGNGIFCQRSHHLRLIGNTIKNMGAMGLGSSYCDYLTADSNQITHNGYLQGWSSGISFNSTQWYDTFAGFHNFVVNNIISGSFDGTHHSDGHGIIMDVSNGTYDPASANTPRALIANNVVYENGGRCVVIFTVTNIWIVNNTCYKNGLDLNESGSGEMVTNQSKNSYWINNVAYSWNNRQPFQQLSSSNPGMVYYREMYYGGNNNFTYSDPSQFTKADPLFASPPVLNATAGGQYATALAPWLLGTALTLQATSPAIDKGIDPTTVPGASADIIVGLRQYVFKDITGRARPLGNGFDLGAYESTTASLPAAPAAIVSETTPAAKPAFLQ